LQRILKLFSVILYFSVEFIPRMWECLLVAASDTQPEPTNMTTTQITQRDFWNLPEIKECQAIQQGSRFGDESHKNAFERMKSICSSQMGAEFAESYFGEYE